MNLDRGQVRRSQGSVRPTTYSAMRSEVVSRMGPAPGIAGVTDARLRRIAFALPAHVEPSQPVFSRE